MSHIFQKKQQISNLLINCAYTILTKSSLFSLTWFNISIWLLHWFWFHCSDFILFVCWFFVLHKTLFAPHSMMHLLFSTTLNHIRCLCFLLLSFSWLSAKQKELVIGLLFSLFFLFFLLLLPLSLTFLRTILGFRLLYFLRISIIFNGIIYCQHTVI